MNREISVDLYARLQVTQLVDWHCNLQMLCRNFHIFFPFICSSTRGTFMLLNICHNPANNNVGITCKQHNNSFNLVLLWTVGNTTPAAAATVAATAAVSEDRFILATTTTPTFYIKQHSRKGSDKHNQQKQTHNCCSSNNPHNNSKGPRFSSEGITYQWSEDTSSSAVSDNTIASADCNAGERYATCTLSK